MKGTMRSRSRRSPLSPVLLAATLGAAAPPITLGCYGPDPAAPRPGAGAPPGPSTPSGTFDPRLVDPRFEQATVDYWRDLRSLGWDATDNEIRRSLRLLAIAAERVPYATSVDLTAAAARLRGGRGEHAPSAPPQTRTGFDGLEELARAFVALAKGPYREGAGVLAAAYGFEQATQAMAAARARGGDRRTAFDVLARGEEMLFAIRGAIGRGEVGLVSEAPPPADFGP